MIMKIFAICIGLLLGVFAIAVYAFGAKLRIKELTGKSDKKNNKRANLFQRVCLFCIFVRNKIYVLEIEMLEPVFMARKHNFRSQFETFTIGN